MTAPSASLHRSFPPPDRPFFLFYFLPFSYSRRIVLPCIPCLSFLLIVAHVPRLSFPLSAPFGSFSVHGFVSHFTITCMVLFIYCSLIIKFVQTCPPSRSRPRPSSPVLTRPRVVLSPQAPCSVVIPLGNLSLPPVLVFSSLAPSGHEHNNPITRYCSINRIEFAL
jgi:hypothetical protein